MTVGVIGSGSYLPARVVTNKELSKRMQVDEEWILHKTGISERRRAAPDQAASDLAVHAARQALDAAGLAAADVGIVVVATGTGDQPAPSTACFVQAQLGASSALCFDVTAVCSGFLYALRVAHDMLVASPSIQHALVIGTDVYSRFSRPEDKKTHVLVGDGAGAVVLGRVRQGGILTSKLGADGTLASVAQVPGGGSRTPASAVTVSDGLHAMQMDGRKIRDFAGPLLRELIAQVTHAINLDLDDIDHVIPHQANGVMLDQWCDLLEIRPGKMHRTVRKYGNTGAASVPITLNESVRSKSIAPGDLVLLIAIGGGVTWGATIIRWSH